MIGLFVLVLSCLGFAPSAGAQTLLSKDASGYGDGGHLTAYVYNGVLKVRLQSAESSKWVQLGEPKLDAGETHHLAISFGEEIAESLFEVELFGERAL